MRRFFRYLGLALQYPFQLLSGVVVTLFALLLLGLNPTIQDFAGDQFAAFLSRQLRTEVRIDRLQLRTNGSLELEGFYLEDHNGDTLIYSDKLLFRIRLRPLLKGDIRISNLALEGLQLRMLRKDYELAFNFDFLLPTPTPDKPVDSVLLLPAFVLEKLSISNSRVILHDYTKKQANGVFNPNHLELENLQLELRDLALEDDSSRVRIQQLRFDEIGGISVESMGFSLARFADQLRIDSLRLQTRRSTLQGTMRFSYGNESDLLAFAERVRMKADVKRLVLDPKELAYFTGLEELPRETIYASGSISGRVSNLRTKDLNIRFDSENYLRGEVNITGLPDVEGALYDLSISDAYLSRSGLARALPFVEIPEQLNALEYIHMTASMFGYPEDFVAHGTFETNLGMLNSDINLKLQQQNTTFSGELNAEALDLRKILNNEQLGNAGFELAVKGRGNKFEELEGQLDGHISYADFKGYRYEGVDFDGYLDKGLFTGKVSSADTNANFDFFGVADLNPSQPFYNFVADIRRVDLKSLHLSEDTVLIQGFAEICLKGTDRDSVEGEVNLRQLELDLNDRHLSLASIDLFAARNPDSSRYITLNAPFGEAKMEGHFSFRQLGTSVNRFVNHYLHKEKSEQLAFSRQDFNFSLSLHDAQPVSDFFFPGKYAIDSLEGYVLYDALHQKSDIFFTLPDFRADSLQLKHVSLIGGSDAGEMNLDLYVDSIFRNGLFVAHTLSAEQTLADDSLRFDLKATGDSSYNRLAIAGFMDTRGDSLKLGFRPSYVDLYGNRWVLEQRDDIWITDSVAGIDNFSFRQARQTISLHGRISADRNDSLYLEMVDVDLQQLNPILAAYETSMEGFANMSVRSSSVLKKAAVFGDIQLDEFVLDGQPLGDVTLSSDYSTELNQANLSASIVNVGDTLMTIRGYLSKLDEEQEIDLDVVLAHSPIHALEKLLKPAFDDVSGYATARLNLKGKLTGPVLTGYADLEKARLRVDFLNQYYNVNKRILFTETSIDFNNATLTDDAGGTGTLSGRIMHEKFRKTRLNLRLDARNLLVLNTQPDYQSDYFGTGKLTGYATFSGPISLVGINIVATTDRGTNFAIPLDVESSRGVTDFITFVNRHDTLKSAPITQNLELEGVELTMNLTVTPDAEISIIFDRQTGDIIKGRGNAVIELKVNPQGEMTMFGNYTFTSGDYTFTLANIANKRFRIASGSTIRWSGDPYDAQLDVNAVYRQRAAVPVTSTVVSGNPTTPGQSQYMNVETHLKLAGSLLSPAISFQLKIPSINQNDPNDANATYIQRINNDEQTLNNQVIALLVAGQFIPEGDVAAGGFAANSGLNSVTEVLSNQLSNLISSDNFNFGVSYRNSNLAGLAGATPANTENISDLNLAVNTSLFDNRVLIDGNVGNRSNSTSDLPGAEVTVEYLVNADGSFRLKAFNRIDDRNIFNRGSTYRQGIGLSYTKNYNTGAELRADATRWLQDRFIRRIPWAPDSWKGDF